MEGRAEVQSVEGNLESASLTSDADSNSDWEAPHQQSIPYGDNTEYCPFYASWIKSAMEEDKDGDYIPRGVVAPEDIMAEGAE
jgi:hypothetical protein